MHAVILAGGKGTRLRPLTDTRPKPLLPFVGDPFAAGLLRRLAAAGCTGATFLVGADGEPFKPLEQLGHGLGVPVTVATEPEPLDTAGAARDLLRGEVDGPVLVCNGDILTDLDYAAVLTAHRAAGATATLALTRVPDTSSFGVVECAGDGTVSRFVEKPAPGTAAADTVNAGTYVLSPDAFEPFEQHGPLSFERTVFPGLLEAGARVLGFVSAAAWTDLGTPERYLDGSRAVLSGECAWPIGDGFTRDGASVLRHATATVHQAAPLDGFVVLGPRVRVDAGARLRSAVLFEDVSVEAGADVSDAILGEGARIAAGAQVTGVVAPGALVG